MNDITPGSKEHLPQPHQPPVITARASKPVPPLRMQAPQGPGMREMLTMVFKHKYKIVALFIIGLAASPFVYYFTPRVYETSALLMVKFGWEYMYNPELSVKGQSSTPYARNEVITSEIQILKSRDLRERVVATLGARNIYPNLARKAPAENLDDLAVLQLDEDFSVKNVPNSSVLKLSVQGANPDMIAKVLTQLIFFYESKRLDIFKDPKSILFLEKKTAEYREKLRETEDELEAFKQKNQVYSLAEQRTLLLGQKANLDSTLLSTENRLKELQQRLASLETQLKTIPENKTVSEPSPGVEISQQPDAQLMALQLKEQELLAKYTDNSPLITDVRKRIEMLKKHLDNPAQAKSAPVMGKASNEVYQQVMTDIIKTKADLSSLEVTHSLLKNQLTQLDKDIQEFDLREKKLRDLERRLASDEKNYQISLSKFEEARVFDDMDRQKMSSVSLVQPAEVPIKPISPSMPLPVYIAMGAVVGLGCGVGLAFALEMSKQAVITPKDAERRLHARVLVTVPFKKG